MTEKELGGRKLLLLHHRSNREKETERQRDRGVYLNILTKSNWVAMNFSFFITGATERDRQRVRETERQDFD